MTDHELTPMSGTPRILFTGQPARGRAWTLKRAMTGRWRFEWPIDAAPHLDVWPWHAWRRKATAGMAECGMDALTVRISRSFHLSPAPTALSAQSSIARRRMPQELAPGGPELPHTAAPIPSLRQVMAEGRGLGINWHHHVPVRPREKSIERVHLALRNLDDQADQRGGSRATNHRPGGNASSRVRATTRNFGRRTN